MRILLVVHAFPPRSEGGSEIYVDAQARTLVRLFGDQVLVVAREADAGRREYAVTRESRDGIDVAWINNTFRLTRSFEDSYRNEALGAVAARLIDEFAPDVAHIHHLTCLSTAIVPALAERKVPIVFTLHDYWLMCHRGQRFDLDERVCTGPPNCARCPERPGPPAIRAMATVLLGAPTRERRDRHMQDIAAQVTQFLTPSEYMRQQFIGFGIPPERIVHAPLGFEHALYERAARPSTGSGRAEKSPSLRLGFVGSLMVSKAPHLLLEAARRFAPGAVTVDLYGAVTPYHGDDSYRARLAPLLSAGGVRHHGPVPHARIPNALASIDALVVPSVWAENSPLVIQEAFLAGVPVIASRIGGIPELVQHDVNGLLFEPGSVDDLQRAIARVIDEPDLLGRLRAGIPAVRTIEEDVASIREMYEKHLEDGPAEAGRHDRSAKAPRSIVSGKIAAVVLNYRTPDDTFLAVRSLLASRRALDEIIVVENDARPSTGSGRAVTWKDDVITMTTGRNLGFSGGMNVGIRAALERGADAVLLVNSDVLLPPDCVERLERVLADTPGAGIVGPTIAARTQPGVVASLGLSYHRATGRMRHEGVGTAIGPSGDGRAQPVDAVSGCAMLVARTVFERVGFFDEDYFFSFEDLDFCFRARAAGFSTVLARDAIAYHEGGQSIGCDAPDRLYFAARNHLLLARRSAPSASAGRRLYRAGAIVALNVGHAAVSNGASLPRRLTAVAQGTLDYFRGRFGAGRSDLRLG